MWWEILPAAMIIYGAFEVHSIGCYLMHTHFLQNAFRRDLRYPFNRMTYLRDRRLMDNPYLYNGLESIPDEADKKEEV